MSGGIEVYRYAPRSSRKMSIARTVLSSQSRQNTALSACRDTVSGGSRFRWRVHLKRLQVPNPSGDEGCCVPGPAAPRQTNPGINAGHRRFGVCRAFHGNSQTEAHHRSDRAGGCSTQMKTWATGMIGRQHVPMCRERVLRCRYFISIRKNLRSFDSEFQIGVTVLGINVAKF